MELGGRGSAACQGARDSPAARQRRNRQGRLPCLALKGHFALAYHDKAGRGRDTSWIRATSWFRPYPGAHCRCMASRRRQGVVSRVRGVSGARQVAGSVFGGIRHERRSARRARRMPGGPRCWDGGRSFYANSLGHVLVSDEAGRVLVLRTNLAGRRAFIRWLRWDERATSRWHDRGREDRSVGLRG